MSNNHEHDRSGFIRHWLHNIMRPTNSATSANTSSDSPSEGHPPPPPYTAASHGDHVEGTSGAPTLSQPLPVAMEVDNAELAGQHSQSPSSQANSTVSDDMPPLVPVADTPSASTSRPPTVSRNSRRARVDDEEDEDDQRETNRQRMHSPSLHDHDHHFHPDIHAHAEEHRQEREQQQQPGPNRPPLFNRISLTFDLFPAFGPLPPQFDTAAGSAQGTARAPGQPQEGATNADGSVPPVDGAHNVGVGEPHDTPPADFAAFLQRLREGMGPIWLGGMDMDEPDDPGRARRLLAGLEEAPAGLIKRMEAVGKEEGEPVVCAICFDSLLDPPSAETTKDDSAEPPPMDVDPTPAPESTSPGSEKSAEDELDKALEHKAVVLPCAHVFHASCLRPWFTRPHRTTCPSCRFDIDPESLTYVPPARVPRPPRTARPPQAAPAPPADAPEVPSATTADNQAQAVESSLPNSANDAPLPQPDVPAAEAADPRPQSQPQNPPRAPQTTVPIGLLIDFNMFFPGLGSTRLPTQGQPDAPANTASGPVPFGPQPPPSAGHPTNPLSMNGAQFQNFFFGPGSAPASAANPPAPAPPAADSQQPAEATPTQPAGSQPSGAPRNAPQSRVVFHSFSFPLGGPGRDRAPSAAGQAAPGGTGQPSNDSPPLPSFEEFIRSVGLPILHPPQRPQPQQEAPQPAQQPQPQPQPAQQPQQQQPPAQDAPATGAAAPGGPQGNPQGPQGFMDAMLGDIASSVFGALFPGAPFVPHTHTHVHHHHPPPPGPIPFAVPLNGQSRGPRPPPPEKRQWTPPPPPGPTLRERIEKKERQLGLRCSDISCGLGPSDEDPTPVIDPRTIRQVAIRPLKGKGPETDKVCEHTFHPACLVSAERVAGWSGADQKKEVEDEQEEVEVSCPVCRAVGCISREDWDEGACALA